MANVPVIRVPHFDWKVENALSVDRLESGVFILDESRWSLRFYRDTFNYICVSLNKLNPEKLIRKYIIQAFAEDHCKKPASSMEYVLNDPNFATKEIWYIKRDVLQEQRDIYLKDGTLKFVIFFTPDNPPGMDTKDERISDKSIQTSIAMDTVADLEDLSLNLHNLMDEGAHSDVTLECEDRSFLVHRGILSARSEVFSAMFRSDMAESRSGVIQISDVDVSTLDQFLHYVYSGELSDLSVDTAVKLYAAADKYSVKSLQELCAKFMKENLTRENACRILVFADTHGDKHLKDYVLCFITNVELLRNKDIWFEFHNEHPKLSSEVLHHAYEAKCLSK